MKTVFTKMSDEEYFSHPAISNSDLKHYVGLGFDNFYYNKYVRPVINTATKSKDLGSLVHCLYLEPDEFNIRYFVSDYKAVSPNESKFVDLCIEGVDYIEAYKQCYAHNKNKPEETEKQAKERYDKVVEHISGVLACTSCKAVSNDDYVKAKQIHDSIRENEFVNELLDSTYNELYYEHALFFELFGLKLKSKIDLLVINKKLQKIYLIDLKTTQYCNEREFIGSIRKYAYDKQIAFYSEGIKLHWKHLFDKGYTLENYIIAAQTNEPYLTEIYSLNGGIVDDAKHRTLENLERLSKDLYNYKNHIVTPKKPIVVNYL